MTWGEEIYMHISDDTYAELVIYPSWNVPRGGVDHGVEEPM